MHVADGFCTEISDTGLYGNASVGLDQEQAVISNGTCVECAGRDPQPTHLGPTSFRLGDTLLPAKLLRTLIECFFQKRAGGVPALTIARRTEKRFSFGAV